MSHAIRQATVDDVPELVALRRVMFEAMGYDDTQELQKMCRASDDYFREHIPAGTFRAWLAEEEGRAIASIGLVIHSIPPAPRRPGSEEAYIMSLVTLPSHRRRGIAAALLNLVIDTVRAEGVSVASLHATENGRRIYEMAGFTADVAEPEMRLALSGG